MNLGPIIPHTFDLYLTCIDSNGMEKEITLGKKYYTSSIHTNNHYSVQNNEGCFKWYERSRFATVEQLREMKLNKILE